MSRVERQASSACISCRGFVTHLLILQDQEMLRTLSAPLFGFCLSALTQCSESLPEPRIRGERTWTVFVWVISIAVPAVFAVVPVMVVVTTVATTIIQWPCVGVLHCPDGEECQHRDHGDRQFLHLGVLLHCVLLI